MTKKTSTASTSGPILEVNDLKVYFDTEEGEVKALENVSYQIQRGQVLGMVGETGSGKSVSAYTVMGLLPKPPGKILKGSVKFKGEEILGLPDKRMRKIRGNDLAMIFQEPMTSLNPVFTIGDQMQDVLQAHNDWDKPKATEQAIDALKAVRMKDPEMVLKKFPHELSGGMRQRVMIAMALSCDPELLVADEPTTALDVTIQAQILGLLKEMQKNFHLSVLLITHNLGVVAQNCDAICVMYAGNIVEYGTSEQIFHRPVHPYTRGLIKAIPPVEGESTHLNIIPGVVPNLIHPPEGCRFHPRCERAKKGKCDSQVPSMADVENDSGHRVNCFFPYLPEDGGVA